MYVMLVLLLFCRLELLAIRLRPILIPIILPMLMKTQLMPYPDEAGADGSMPGTYSLAVPPAPSYSPLPFPTEDRDPRF